MKYVLIVIQISETWPHDVRVARRIIESDVSSETLYTAVEPEARECLRDGFSLCNWHLFDWKPEVLQQDSTEFTLASGKSIASLLRKFATAV